MKLLLQRFVDDGDTTGGVLLIDGIFNCFIIEDQHQTEKVWGEMRIPEGTYNVSIRKEGGIHARYSRKFGSWHKGMLCIHNAPDWKIVIGEIVFQWVMFHIGNSDDDTAGCPLPNETFNSSTMRGSGSTNAYKRFYPIVIEALLKGEKVSLEVIDIEPGK